MPTEAVVSPVDGSAADPRLEAYPSTFATIPSPSEVVRRSGERIPFDRERIRIAVSKALLSARDPAESEAELRAAAGTLVEAVVESLHRRGRRAVHVEEIQDQAELALMRSGRHAAARAYVLYREERRKARHARGEPDTVGPRMRDAAGQLAPLDPERLRDVLAEACADLPEADPDPVLQRVLEGVYDGITAAELAEAQVLAARTLVERDPVYERVAARLLLRSLRQEALGFVTGRAGDGSARAMHDAYAPYFQAYVRRGAALGLVDPELLTFDLERLAGALRPERDLQLGYLGLQTLYDRYLLHHERIRFELPQAFFMRVAMGLALGEDRREERAAEFYELLSTFRFMCSTPTLFNAGTRRPQLSSCFLTTVPDDLDGIYSAIKDNALLSKYAGGLGNDWTPVRGLGARIRGTNGVSQGVIPFLKVANDTAVAVNQGGRRKGAVCAYLEVWHVDVEEFLDLRRNTGDDRRRTHDMHTALWIPDLFMKRVAERGPWTLFSPDEATGLHDAWGAAFEERYLELESAAVRGELRVHRTVEAEDLWRRALSRLFETGHPWITFKDPCNVRSPQNHCGVVHSSNLCTEITLNTSIDEVAVCNLGSVNLPAHCGPGGLDRDTLADTIRTAVRMLDNVIDINYYTVPRARRSNLRHRPVGLGIMGFQDALFRLRLPYGSKEAVRFADESMELVSHLALSASCDLAAERGPYESFRGSLWNRGVLPIDSIAALEAERGGHLRQDRGSTLDWDSLRERIRSTGLRNSNVLAIAPTATISNICGVSQSIEPLYRNLYVKSNLSGEFTVVNPYLVADLKERGLWDAVMISDLKLHDGSVADIARVPADLKALYATAFEIDCTWLVEAASRRQKWIDQSQSLNLYVDRPEGALLDRLYKLAWELGLKTTYYLRSQGATAVEKSTLSGTDGRLNAVPLEDGGGGGSPALATACILDEADCEACQ